MGLLSIFNRKKTAADSSRPTGRGAGKARATQRTAASPAMAAPADAAEAVRDARARARRRLMGATVLLLVGVIGFPLLFETQPRPIPVDLRIDIPSRNAPAGVETGAQGARGASGGAVAQSPAAAESVSYDARPPAATAPAPHPAVAAAPAEKPPADKPPAEKAPAEKLPADKPVAERPAAPAPAEKPVAAAKPAPAPASRPTPHLAQAEPTPTPSASSTAAAAALLEAPNPGVDRYIVQVAAFKPTDDAKIRDIRGRLEKLGLKTYTQPVKTPGGEWIRVRLGPYGTKAEADSAVARISAAGLGLQPKVYMP